MKRACSFDDPRPKKKVRFAEPLVQELGPRTLVQQLSSEVENLLGSFVSGTNTVGNLEEHQSVFTPLPWADCHIAVWKAKFRQTVELLNIVADIRNISDCL